MLQKAGAGVDVDMLGEIVHNECFINGKLEIQSMLVDTAHDLQTCGTALHFIVVTIHP
jgi:hypothetical protein